MTSKKITYWHLFHLGMGALVLRLGYLLLAVQNLGLERFANWTNDTSLYRTVAEHILHGHEQGAYGLLRIGPGYALILAVIRIIFGTDPTFAILFSVLMGSLAPVFVYLLAWHLIGSRAVALAAGIISAVSLTSIALSCHILTDQPFFTLFAAALVCFVLGFKSGKMSWFVLAGVVGAIGALVRPSGQMCFLIFLAVPMMIPLPSVFSSRMAMLKRAGISAAIMLLVVLSWSTRNYVKEDLFVFSTNGVFTLQGTLLAHVMVTHTEGLSIFEFRQQCEDTDSVFAGHHVRGYHRARDRVINAVKDHPDWFWQSYRHFLDENIRAYNYFPERQMPIMSSFVRRLNEISFNWFSYVLLYTTLAGLVLLLIERNFLAAALLGTTFAYFTLLIGLSFWQGSRLHYPAEMAWSIVVPYAVYRLGHIFRKPAAIRNWVVDLAGRLHRRRSSRENSDQ